MVALPRLLIAAASTGAGKTTIATGLMAALRARGLIVSGHKVGPDYIDPGYHALATGRPGRNLDPHLVGEDRIVPLLLHGASGAEVAVIEGVMGLHDGRIGDDGFASSAHVARLTATPVVLVLDIARASRSAAAIAAGVAGYDPRVRIAGVVLNRAGTERNVAEIRQALRPTGLPVLGVLPRDERLAAPSRHLGLVPAAERDASASMIERLGEQVATHLDLDALLAIAGSAPALDAVPWNPADEVRAAGAGSPVVAVAGGRAFTFRYPETEELLRAAGCAVVGFDPLTDPALPAGTRGIYLGGGFPEMYAAELAGNRSLLRDLRRAVADGVPTVAECAGLLYLAESLDGVPMAGALPVRAVMTPTLTLRYPVAEAAADTLLTRAGERVTGHEFHRTQVVSTSSASEIPAQVSTSPTTETPPADPHPPLVELVETPAEAWIIDGMPTGLAGPTVHASYLHVHWAGHPLLAQRFADAVHAAAPHTPSAAGSSDDITEAAVPATRPPGEPLRHHGDDELAPGLLDLAVNVYPGARPAWLDRALRASIASSTGYPDAARARRALAARHGRDSAGVLPSAGAAEAFTLIARLPWRRPVVVHPQFTEPHAALERAGHPVGVVTCRAADGFALRPAAVPEDADLVIVGNPTNPTGVLHPAAAIRALCRPGRLVVVDEAFMDAVPGESESLAAEPADGLLVIRSLTKHWSIPGIRAGYVVGDPAFVERLAALQPPWSVPAPALAAMIACSTAEALTESGRRAAALAGWRAHLEAGLAARDVDYVPSSAPFVLARPGHGMHAQLRAHGIAVRRGDTFPGLDECWVRIAVRPPSVTDRLLEAL